MSFAQNSVQSASWLVAGAALFAPKALASFWPRARAGEAFGRAVLSATRTGALAAGRAAARGAAGAVVTGALATKPPVPVRRNWPSRLLSAVASVARLWLAAVDSS